MRSLGESDGRGDAIWKAPSKSITLYSKLQYSQARTRPLALLGPFSLKDLTPSRLTDTVNPRVHDSFFQILEQGRPARIARGFAAGFSSESIRRVLRVACRQRFYRCRGPLRPPRQPVEPQDEAVHLRQAQPDSYHRLERNGPRSAPRDQVLQPRCLGQRPDPVRRHQAPGGRDDHRAVQPRRDALRDRAVAGRDAHQLPDDPQPAPAARGAGKHPGRRAGAVATPRR